MGADLNPDCRFLYRFHIVINLIYTNVKLVLNVRDITVNITNILFLPVCL